MSRRAFALFLMPSLLTVAVTGCAREPRVVQPGDRVGLGFTCRLPGGELAVTTMKDDALAAEPKSPLYLPRTGLATETVTAGPAKAGAPSLKPFETAVVERLAATAVGLREGDELTMTLTADRQAPESADQRPTRIARVRKREKEMRLTVDDYTARTGKKPEVGQPLTFDPLVPGTVSSVSDKEVVVQFAPTRREGLQLPFGPATIRETADRYEIVIDAKPGRLFRTGGLAGRVAAVDDEFITLDYSHPFAGETLDCRVKVVDVTPAPVTSSSVPPPSVAAAAATPAARQEEALAKAFHDFMATTPGIAADGDLARVDFTASLPDGSVVYTTRQEVGEDLSQKKVSWYAKPAAYSPQELVVGKPDLFPGLGEAVSGMAIGEKKRFSVPPEKGFGPVDPAKQLALPLKRTFPRQVSIPAEEYVKRFGGFPTVGKEVPLTPWFPARVTGIDEKSVAVEFLVKDGAEFNDPFGTTRVEVQGDEVTTTLSPIIGALFPVKEGEGTISSSDGTTFTVDLNHPLAGKTITVDLELSGVVKAADLPKGEIGWQEEHDAGLARAKEEGKPAVLVLYADWCGFCKKLFSETLPDPRIRALYDRFTWVRVNSDKKADVKKRYGQDGYPMIVLFRADGTIARKIDGFQEPAAFGAALRGVL